MGAWNISLETKMANGVIINTLWRMMKKQREIFLLSFNREEDLFWFSFHKKLQHVAGENAESPEVTNSPYYCQSTPTCASKDVRIQPASPVLMILRRSNIRCLKGGEKQEVGLQCVKESGDFHTHGNAQSRYERLCYLGGTFYV